MDKMNSNMRAQYLAVKSPSTSTSKSLFRTSLQSYFKTSAPHAAQPQLSISSSESTTPLVANSSFSQSHAGAGVSSGTHQIPHKKKHKRIDKTLLYVKEDWVYYLSTYVFLFIFWFLTWIFILLAMTNTTVQDTLSGKFWTMIALACVAAAFVAVTFCLREISQSGIVAFIVFILYASTFTFVVMWVTWEFNTWLVFYIFTILLALNLVTILAICITSFTHLQNMNVVILGVLAILFVLITLICVVTATSTVFLHIFLSVIINLSCAAWFVFDASNIAQQREKYLEKTKAEREELSDMERNLSDVSDSMAAAYRLYLSIVSGGFFIADAVKDAEEKKKQQKEQEAEQKAAKRRKREADELAALELKEQIEAKKQKQREKEEQEEEELDEERPRKYMTEKSKKQQAPMQLPSSLPTSPPLSPTTPENLHTVDIS